MSDGTADGVFCRPDDARRLPGVIFLTDIGGIRPAQQGMAGRLAGAGYAVLLPNIFYRTNRSPISRARADWVDQLRASLGPGTVERDAAGYVNFLAAQTGVTEGTMGIVGHCFSGGVAMRMAATLPDRITAMASFHAGGLYTDAPTSLTPTAPAHPSAALLRPCG